MSTELGDWDLFLWLRLQQNRRPTPHCTLSRNQPTVSLHKLCPKPWAAWLSAARQMNFLKATQHSFSLLSATWETQAIAKWGQTQGPALQTNSGTEIQVFISQNLGWCYGVQILLSTKGSALPRWKWHNTIKMLVSSDQRRVLKYLLGILLVFSYLFRLRGRHYRFKEYLKGTRTARIVSTSPQKICLATGSIVNSEQWNK